MDILQIVVLALIQGITEFLPISSSAHLILPAQLTEWPDQGLPFDVALHLGSLTAVVVYFRGDLRQFGTGGILWLRERRPDPHAALLMKVLLAVLPMVVAGLILKDWVASDLRSVQVIATATAGFAVLLWLADRRHGEQHEISWNHALTIGLFQTLALIPGTSRSGITMTAALLLGISRVAGARFSFLLSIPTIAGAALLSTVDLLEDPGPVDSTALVLGFAIAAVSAYACIYYFLAFIERTGMAPYVIYRFLLGAALWIWFV